MGEGLNSLTHNMLLAEREKIMEHQDYNRRINDLEQRVRQLEAVVSQNSIAVPERGVQPHVQKLTPVPPQPVIGTQTSQPFAPPPVIHQRSRDMFNTKHLLALLGGIITLFGLSFIVLLSIRYNWITPQMRVGGLFLISSALVAGGLYAKKVNKPNNVPIALFATGISGLYLTIIAMHSIYHWIPSVAALTLSLIVAAVGYFVSYRWMTRAALITNAIGAFISSLIIFTTVPNPNPDNEYVVSLFLFIIFLANLYPIYKNKWDVMGIFNVAYGVIIASTLARDIPEKQLYYDFVDMSYINEPAMLRSNIIGLVLMLIVFIVAQYMSKRIVVVAPLLGFAFLASMFKDVITLDVLIALFVISLGYAFMLKMNPSKKNAHVFVVASASYLFYIMELSVEMYNTHIAQISYNPHISDLIQEGALASQYRQEQQAHFIGVCLYLVAGIIAAIICYKMKDRMAHLFSFTVLAFSTAVYVFGSGFLTIWSKSNVASNASWAIIAMTALLEILVLIIAYNALSVEAPVRLFDKDYRLGNFKQISALSSMLAIAVIIVFTATMITGSNGFYAGHLITTFVWFGISIVMLYLERDWSNKLYLGMLLLSTLKLFIFDLSTLDGVLRAFLFLGVGLSILVISYLLSKRDKKDLPSSQPAPLTESHNNGE